MNDARFTFVVVIFLYTFVIDILLFYKDYTNKTLSKGSLFNFCLWSFTIALLARIVGYSIYNPQNGLTFFDVFIGKFHMIFSYLFVYLYTIYCAKNLFDIKIGFTPKFSFINLYTFSITIFTFLEIIILPASLRVIDKSIYLQGPMYVVTSVTIFLVFVPIIVLFFMNLKKVDVFKALGPILAPALMVTAYYVRIKHDATCFDLVYALILVITYFGIEKRDEKLQKDIVDTTVQMERALRFKNDFLSSMSHEIKSPLNSILANSRNLSSKSSIKNEINDILYSSDNLKEVIDNILTISKIEMDKLSINNITYDIKKEIDDIPFVEKLRIYSHGINFSFECSHDLPKVIKGSKDIVLNIIDNVLSYNYSFLKKGTLALSIGWEENDKNSNLVIKVISVEPGLGNIYKDADDIKIDIYDSYGNSQFGLGLAIILCEKLNGKYSFSHEDDKSTIEFLIPHDKNTLDINFDTVKFDDKQVLLVDDSELNHKIGSRVLDSLNIKHDSAYSGSECLELVDKNKYDYILLDIMMPNMSGEETFNMLKEKGNTTPVIALTADEAGGAREKYLNEGFSGYILKPFNKVDLVNEIYRIQGGDK